LRTAPRAGPPRLHGVRCVASRAAGRVAVLVVRPAIVTPASPERSRDQPLLLSLGPDPQGVRTPCCSSLDDRTSVTSAALRPHALPPRTLTRLTAADCTATQWSTAREKADAGNQVLAFIENGLHPDAFTPALYRTCYQHLFAHIAHFDRHGFADVWFTTPQDKADFIRHAMNASGLGDPEIGRAH